MGNLCGGPADGSRGKPVKAYTEPKKQKVAVTWNKPSTIKKKAKPANTEETNSEVKDETKADDVKKVKFEQASKIEEQPEPEPKKEKKQSREDMTDEERFEMAKKK